MRRFMIWLMIVLLMVVGSIAGAQEYLEDPIVTGKDAVWVDLRAYATLADALTDIGGDDVTLMIAEPTVVVDATIPVNVKLKFSGDGSIIASGTVAIQTRWIEAGFSQIFAVTGAGEFDFDNGTVVKASWFANVGVAIAQTNNDAVRLRITEPSSIPANVAVGNYVTLEFGGPGCEMSVAPGVDVTNVGDVIAGDFRIFTGAGDFDFVAGTQLKSVWFRRLRSIPMFVGVDEVEVAVVLSETIDANVTFDANTTLVIPRGNVITIPGGMTLTISGSVIAGPYQVFAVVGTLNITDYPQNTAWIGGADVTQDVFQGSAGGTTINEFSTDDTLAGDSDDAVPTEQAVKAYADAITAALAAAERETSRALFKYSTATAILVEPPAQYWLDGAAADRNVWATAQITFTLGAGGSNGDSDNLGANEFHYIYLDDSAIAGAGGAISASDLLNDTTAPTWNDTKSGWYNGGDRCIFAILTDGASQIVQFWHTGDIVFYDEEFNERTTADLDATYVNVDMATSVPGFSTKAEISAYLETKTADANIYAKWRPNGSTDSTGHRILGLERIGTDQGIFAGGITVILDLGQIFEVAMSRDGDDTLGVVCDGWYFPREM